MAKLVAPHGTVVDVEGLEAVRLRRAGWKPVQDNKPVKRKPESVVPESGKGK